MTNHSHYKDPIDTAVGRVGGFSREAGGASDEVKQKVIDMIVSKAHTYGLPDRDTANLIAIAKVESRFNPDAATPGHQSSASGVFQITDSTAKDAHQRLDGTSRINGHKLGEFNRFDLNSNIEHGIAIYLDKKATAKSGDVASIYKAWNTNPAEYNKFLGQLRDDSNKYLGELQSKGGLALSSTGSSAATITSAGHPGHGLYEQALHKLQKWNHDHHIKVDPQSTRNTAAALAVEAHQHRLTRIDHVEPNEPGDKLIAVQGKPGAVHSKVVVVDTMVALNTPVAQSSQAFTVVQQAQQQAPQHNNQQAAQQAAPAMSR
ncbi:XVIPCD domain-containing protein [Variovorax sp. AFSI2.2]|uniref:XVIPCD domain-containing protein n=1 Tax=Variovorax sp. AFSI2.2 TaxID=3384160 RepID=UPI003EC07949